MRLHFRDTQVINIVWNQMSPCQSDEQRLSSIFGIFPHFSCMADESVAQDKHGAYFVFLPSITNYQYAKLQFLYGMTDHASAIK